MKLLYNNGIVLEGSADPDKKIKDLKDEDVQWIVNDLSELGVRIGDQVFFLYKGRSIKSGEKIRRVGKREFGECVHPDKVDGRRSYVGYHDEPEELWEEIK